MSVRFHIERVSFIDLQKGKHWYRESIAGTKSIAAARADLKDMINEAPSYLQDPKDWRIVKVTTTRKVVK